MPVKTIGTCWWLCRDVKSAHSHWKYIASELDRYLANSRVTPDSYNINALLGKSVCDSNKYQGSPITEVQLEFEQIVMQQFMVCPLYRWLNQKLAAESLLQACPLVGLRCHICSGWKRYRALSKSTLVGWWCSRSPDMLVPGGCVPCSTLIPLCPCE